MTIPLRKFRWYFQVTTSSQLAPDSLKFHEPVGCPHRRRTGLCRSTFLQSTVQSHRCECRGSLPKHQTYSFLSHSRRSLTHSTVRRSTSTSAREVYTHVSTNCASRPSILHARSHCVDPSRNRFSSGSASYRCEMEKRIQRIELNALQNPLMIPARCKRLAEIISLWNFF